MTREEAIELLEDLDGAIEDNHGRDYDEAFRMAIKSLSADTVSRSQYQGLLNAIGKVYVEVVRCKDCRHYESDGGALMVCSDTGVVVDDTDYCSYGERREEVNGFKSVGQAWNTSQERRYK